jgi:hypothetical protein
VALGQVFLRVLRFSPVNIIPPWGSTFPKIKKNSSFTHSSSSGDEQKARKSGRSSVRRESHPHNHSTRNILKVTYIITHQKGSFTFKVGKDINIIKIEKVSYMLVGRLIQSSQRTCSWSLLINLYVGIRYNKYLFLNFWRRCVNLMHIITHFPSSISLKVTQRFGSFGFHKRRGIFWPVQRLLASKDHALWSYLVILSLLQTCWT